jgi:hypothetical protein
MVAATDAQRARYARPERDTWAGLAQNFKLDPRRPLDALLTKIASYVQQDDTLIDVGGGAGRLSLPLALRCREVVIADPSPAMREVFEASVKDSGIGNASFVQSGWLEAEGVAGDVALVAHVTYFVPEIVPFIEKLQAATRRRVLVVARSVPPPNQIAGFFRLAHDEELAPVPGHEELLSVLDEMDIAPEVIDIGPAAAPATLSIGTTREDAVRFETEGLVRAGWLRPEATERVSRLFDEHFDELFVETDKGFWRRSALDARDLLITWETS